MKNPDSPDGSWLDKAADASRRAADAKFEPSPPATEPAKLRIAYTWLDEIPGNSSRDVHGVLVAPDGSGLWSHVSSSPQWLEADLTKRTDRAALLNERYPNGWTVEMMDVMRPLVRYDPEAQAEATVFLHRQVELEIALLRREVGRLQVRADRAETALKAAGIDLLPQPS